MPRSLTVKRILWTCILAGGLAPPLIAAQPAGASELRDLAALVEAQAAQLEALQKRIDALEQRLATQHAGGAAASPDESSLSSSGDAAVPADPPTRIAWKGAPELTSPDGQFTAKLRGRVLADAWATSSRTDGIRYPSGTTLRAARLGIEGLLGTAFRYKFETDFAGDNVTVKDAFLQYVGRPGWTVTLGNQKPPFSLEHITGLPRTTFLERALPNVFAIPESLGASVSASGARWTLALAMFGETPAVELDAEESYGIASRTTFVPVLAPGRLLHLGLSGYHRTMSSDSGAAFRIRQRPEVRVFGTRLLDTGPIPADTSTAMGLELAGTRGPFAIQGEYMRNWVDFRNQDNAVFDGGYIQAGWFVTGESRPYDSGKASLGRVRPRAALDAGGWGAIEIAARFSTLDLEDGIIQGGREDNLTFGLNWYPTAHTRFAFNWIYFDVDGNTATLPFGSPDHTGHAFGARAQVDW